MASKPDLFSDESGATAIEYGLIICLLVFGLLVSIAYFGQFVSGTFNTVGNAIGNSAPTGR